MTDSPPAPPRSEGEAIQWLQLIRSWRVGPSTFYRLLAEQGSAAAALAALPDLAARSGVTDYKVYDPARAEQEYGAGRRAGANLLCAGAADYPVALSDLDTPPPVLWARGRVDLGRRPAVALVGARNASSLGTRMARDLARDLGQAGRVIVSGLARGIDAAAHKAALEAGTIAVLAGGIDVIYPPENAELAASIGTQGLLLSEQPLGLTPQARHFPRRNRLISALAQGVVVVEAATRSGSLITARDAADQGREVLAVPGHPFDARASGCNLLLRDGATLVRDARDVLDALPDQAQAPVAEPAPDPAPPQAAPSPSALGQHILDRLGPSPMAENDLIRDLQAPTETVTAALIDLELQGAVERSAGGLLARVARA